MIDDILYKIEKETLWTRVLVLHCTRVNAVQVPKVSRIRLEYKGDVQRVNAVHELRSDPYKMGVRRILRTNRSCARQDIYLHLKYL